METMEEGFGESSSPSSRGFVATDTRNEIYARLLEIGNHEAVSDPDFFQLLDAHLSRLPPSYGLDVSVDRAEDVVMHQKILAEARDLSRRPVFHVRFLKFIQNITDGDNELQQSPQVCSTSGRCKDTEGERDFPSNFRQDVARILTHEIIFSTLDKPKLLSQLSALLSDIGLNIREACLFNNRWICRMLHVFRLMGSSFQPSTNSSFLARAVFSIVNSILMGNQLIVCDVFFHHKWILDCSRTN